jgi:hypothetical protein
MNEERAHGWCRALGITPPTLEAVAEHPEASTFALLLVALLERGEPMTLPDVAARLEAAGIGERARLLLSLKRCRPGSPPIYREGDLYHLDPHHDALELWACRLELRPPAVAPVRERDVELAPLPSSETALTFDELDEAWKDAFLHGWSAQRLALAVLDASGGARSPAEVVAAVDARAKQHDLCEDAPALRRRGSAVEVLDDGRWAIAPDAEDRVLGTRRAVRERVARARRRARAGMNKRMATP